MRAAILGADKVDWTKRAVRYTSEETAIIRRMIKAKVEFEWSYRGRWRLDNAPETNFGRNLLMRPVGWKT